MRPEPAMTSKGFVSLIGAGPGDPGLITVKGLDRLRRAGVVLYDRLVAPQLLDEIDPAAEAIDVGKAPARHRFSQDAINALLVEKAGLGRRVARLKGGDPFVFGRGGEECRALAEAGISYEVIPGVSSAVAVPAYAGIPVTQRGITSSFTVIAGHNDDALGELDLNVLPSGTLVFLMGISHLPAIRARLLAHGLPASTPVAVIERGTTGQQVVVDGNLDNILERARGIRPPAVIVVGEVVRLRRRLAWFEELGAAETVSL